MLYSKNSDNSRTFTPETQDEIDTLDYIDTTLGFSGLPRVVTEFVKQRAQQKTYDILAQLHGQVLLLPAQEREAAIAQLVDVVGNARGRLIGPTPLPITPVTEIP